MHLIGFSKASMIHRRIKTTVLADQSLVHLVWFLKWQLGAHFHEGNEYMSYSFCLQRFSYPRKDKTYVTSLICTLVLSRVIEHECCVVCVRSARRIPTTVCYFGHLVKGNLSFAFHLHDVNFRPATFRLPQVRVQIWPERISLWVVLTWTTLSLNLGVPLEEGTWKFWKDLSYAPGPLEYHCHR